MLYYDFLNEQEIVTNDTIGLTLQVIQKPTKIVNLFLNIVN